MHHINVAIIISTVIVCVLICLNVRHSIYVVFPRPNSFACAAKWPLTTSIPTHHFIIIITNYYSVHWCMNDGFISVKGLWNNMYCIVKALYKYWLDSVELDWTTLNDTIHKRTKQFLDSSIRIDVLCVLQILLFIFY